MSNPDSTPGDRLSIKLNGRLGTAGTVDFRVDGEDVASLVLPPQEMGVLSVLVEELFSSGWSAGFVRTDSLARLLYAKNLASEMDPEVVVKAVFRMRSRLDGLDLSDFFNADADEWSLGKWLIETQPYLGYRVRLSAERISRPPRETPPGQPGPASEP